MAIVAAQICLDQMLGNDGRLSRRTAANRDDAVRKRKQPDVVDNHVSLRFATRRLDKHRGAMHAANVIPNWY